MALITYEELKKLPDISIRMYKSIYNVPAEATLEELAIAMGILDKPKSSEFEHDEFYRIVKSEFETIDHGEGKISKNLGVDPNRLVFKLPSQFEDIDLYKIVLCFIMDEDIVKSKNIDNILKKYNIRELAFVAYIITDELTGMAKETVKEVVLNYKKYESGFGEKAYRKPFNAYLGSPIFGKMQAIAIECILNKYAKLEEYEEGAAYAEKFIENVEDTETYTKMFEYIFLELAKHGEQVFFDFIKKVQINGFLALNVLNEYGLYLMEAKEDMNG